MRVIVCGGRDFGAQLGEHILAYDTLFALGPDVTLVCGGARGADQMAIAWHNITGTPVEVFPADWKKHGRAAGPIRNQQMLDAGADLVIAFPGGRGTADMVQRARKAGIPVREVQG